MTNFTKTDEYILNFLNDYMFEINDSELKENIINNLTKELNEMKYSNIQVICDESNNSIDDIFNGRMFITVIANDPDNNLINETYNISPR